MEPLIAVVLQWVPIIAPPGQAVCDVDIEVVRGGELDVAVGGCGPAYVQAIERASAGWRIAAHEDQLHGRVRWRVQFDDDVVTVGYRLPQRVRAFEASYPWKADDVYEPQRCYALLSISPSGVPVDIGRLRSPDPCGPRFWAQQREAMRRWRFEPQRWRGRSAGAQLTYVGMFWRPGAAYPLGVRRRPSSRKVPPVLPSDLPVSRGSAHTLQVVVPSSAQLKSSRSRQQVEIGGAWPVHALRVHGTTTCEVAVYVDAIGQVLHVGAGTCPQEFVDSAWVEVARLGELPRVLKRGKYVASVHHLELTWQGWPDAGRSPVMWPTPSQARRARGPTYPQGQLGGAGTSFAWVTC